MYLCAATPNHTYKLVQAWMRQPPAWFGWMMGPAIYAHWLVLLTSQASAWGNWGEGRCTGRRPTQLAPTPSNRPSGKAQAAHP